VSGRVYMCYMCILRQIPLSVSGGMCVLWSIDSMSHWPQACLPYNNKPMKGVFSMEVIVSGRLVKDISRVAFFHDAPLRKRSRNCGDSGADLES
jgi:hypothetical protein